MKPNWFVGLPVVADALVGLYAGVPPGVRTFAISDLHVTVAFLGPAEADHARHVWNSYEPTLPAQRVAIGEAQLFGSRNKATALGYHIVPHGSSGRRALANRGRVASVSPGAAFRDALRRDRTALLDAAGLSPDKREPRPHVTIARLPRSLGSLERRKAIRWAESRELSGEIVLDRVALYTWSDERPEIQFRIVDEYALSS